MGGWPALNDTTELRKARGAFFTPPELCRYIAEWAIRDRTDRVLEPSCGEAEFLLAAADRIQNLAFPAASQPTAALRGIELHADTAREASRALRAAGHEASISVGDFFEFDATGDFDAVIGNPPFVRFHGFVGESRRRSQEAALRGGVPLTNLASSWAAFVVHSALFLRPGGRLGLVLPAELMTVNYAADVRRFLLERFQKIELLVFTERVFPEVQAEVVVLFADGYDKGPASDYKVSQALNLAGLPEAVTQSWRPKDNADRWSPSLLSAASLDVYTRLAASEPFATLAEWGDTTLGMVTGNNNYFTLNQDQMIQHGLASSDVIQICPPGSSHLRGLMYGLAYHNGLTAEGKRTFLFRPSGEPSPAAKVFIENGVETGVSRAYKCRVRKPWWLVPLVAAPDLFLTYMNADTPRLCSNPASLRHLNSVHGLHVRPGFRRLAKAALPTAALNSLTLLGAEIVGRAYGGGILKIEPKEADRLPVPSTSVVLEVQSELAAIRPQVAAKLRTTGGLLDAVRLVDDVLLVGCLGLRRSEIRHLRDAHAEISARRYARGRSTGGSHR